MALLLKGILIWVLGSAVARVLAGAGLALGTYATLEPLLQQFLSLVMSSFGGLLPEVAAIIWIAGVGEAVAALASAMVARMALQSAMIFIGKA